MKIAIEKNPEGGWDVVDSETYQVLASEPTRDLARQSARQIRQREAPKAKAEQVTAPIMRGDLTGYPELWVALNMWVVYRRKR